MSLRFRGFPKIRGTLLGVPLIRTNYRILGSILGSPLLGNYQKRIYIYVYMFVCVCTHTYIMFRVFPYIHIRTHFLVCL